MTQLSQKMLRSVTLLSFAIIVASCKDEPAAPAEEEEAGPVVGSWDGESWTGAGFAVHSGDSIRVAGYRPDPFYHYHEEVGIEAEFTGAGNYQTRGRMAKITGGDAGYIRSTDVTLVISEYLPAVGTARARVRGSFSMTSVQSTLPWRFESGTFDVPVYASWLDAPCVVCIGDAPALDLRQQRHALRRQQPGG